MPMKIEQKKVTYDHAVDHMTNKRSEIPRAPSVEPNASLTEAVNAVGNPGRLQCEYTVGKKPETKFVSHGAIEGLRPAKSEMKNG